MAEKSEKRLTPKQEIFSAELIKNGGNATAAALKAYPNATYASAKTIGWENMTKLNLAKAVREEFSRQGVTLEKALRPIVKGLEATDKAGNDDLDKQMRAHDRWLRASFMDKDDGLQLNIENAQGIEITFKNMGVNDAADGQGTPSDVTQDAQLCN